MEGVWGRFCDDTRFRESGIETRSFRVVVGVYFDCVFVVCKRDFEGVGIEGMIWRFGGAEISAISE